MTPKRSTDGMPLTSFGVWAFLGLSWILIGSGCSSSTAEPTSGTSATVAQSSSSESGADWYEQYLDEEWNAVLMVKPDLQRPTVTMVRAVSPLEFPTEYVACMHDGGFPGVVVASDGSIASGDIDPELVDSYLLNRYVCSGKYPIDPDYNKPLTDSQSRILYDFYVNDLAPCIGGLGYLVESPPTFEVFLEQVRAGDFWSPVQVAAGTDLEIYNAITQSCETVPVDLYN